MLANKSLPPPYHYRLAQLFQRANKLQQMMQALDMCLPKMPDDMPANVYLDMARMYNQGKNPDGMHRAMQRYLKRNPKDWRAWLDLATLEVRRQKRNEAAAALNSAIRYGGQEAETMIRKNPLLQSFRVRAGGRPQGAKKDLSSLINLGR